VGNIVGYGDKTLLTTIIADDPMYAYFNPNEEQFQLIKQYRSKAVLDARVTVPGSHRKMLDRKPLKGVVDFNDNRVDGMTGTITMRARVDNPDHDLLEGTFVYVDLFVTDQAEFIMVPPGIVLDDQRGSFVYVVDDKGAAKRVDISRGLETRNYLAVTAGLKGGEKVILSGLAKVRPGTRIDPTDVTESKGVKAILRKQGMIPEKE
jgi:RND family efflux transporter MFP subunit